MLRCGASTVAISVDNERYSFFFSQDFIDVNLLYVISCDPFYFERFFFLNYVFHNRQSGWMLFFVVFFLILPLNNGYKCIKEGYKQCDILYLFSS